ncbi:MAG: hypothetical protein JWM00_474 [Candidatus Saccharibacteria bacterium]|nr:hypothetical protein [Candidatus Saccharibacteria bacterium]
MGVYSWGDEGRLEMDDDVGDHVTTVAEVDLPGVLFDLVDRRANLLPESLWKVLRSFQKLLIQSSLTLRWCTSTSIRDHLLGKLMRRSVNQAECPLGGEHGHRIFLHLSCRYTVHSTSEQSCTQDGTT